MAKGGINLTPRADATLVNQAARMGMAGVPKDLSKTFKGMSDSYASFMGTIGKVGSSIGQTVGKLAGEAIKQGVETTKALNQNPNDLGGFSDFFTEEIQNVKNLRKSGDRFKLGKEGKEARQLFRKERDKLFNQMQGVKDGTIANATALTQGTFNAEATGAENMLLNNLILNKGNAIKDGEYKGAKAKMFKDENGDVAFKFVNNEGKEVAGVNEETGELIVADENNPAKVVRNDQVGSLIKPSVPEIDETLASTYDNIVKDGVDGNPFNPNRVKLGITKLTQTENGFLHAVHTTMPGMDQSYADMLTMPNDATEEMYQALFDIDKDGDVDADDKAASGASDVNFGEGYNTVENFKKFRKAMLDPNNKAAKDIFANKVVESMADGYQSGVDATQAQADAKMQEFAIKEDIKQENVLERKELAATKQLEKIRLQDQLKKENDAIRAEGQKQREKDKNKLLTFDQGGNSVKIQSEQVYNVIDKINEVVMTPTPEGLNAPIVLGGIVFKFDDNKNILVATAENEDGTYEYGKKFEGSKRNEFFASTLGINKGEYGLLNF